MDDGGWQIVPRLVIVLDLQPVVWPSMEIYLEWLSFCLWFPWSRKLIGQYLPSLHC